MFPVTYAMISRQGGRDYNEDSVGAEQDGERWCFVLADGLGGHGKGEVASGIAVTVSKKCFLEGREDLSAWFEEAQKSISEVQTRLHAESQMKTTMSAVELTPEKLAKFIRKNDDRQIEAYRQQILFVLHVAQI